MKSRRMETFGLTDFQRTLQQPIRTSCLSECGIFEASAIRCQPSNWAWGRKTALYWLEISTVDQIGTHFSRIIERWSSLKADRAILIVTRCCDSDMNHLRWHGGWRSFWSSDFRSLLKQHTKREGRKRIRNELPHWAGWVRSLCRNFESMLCVPKNVPDFNT